MAKSKIEVMRIDFEGYFPRRIDYRGFRFIAMHPSITRKNLPKYFKAMKEDIKHLYFAGFGCVYIYIMEGGRYKLMIERFPPAGC